MSACPKTCQPERHVSNSESHCAVVDDRSDAVTGQVTLEERRGTTQTTTGPFIVPDTRIRTANQNLNLKTKNTTLNAQS